MNRTTRDALRAKRHRKADIAGYELMITKHLRRGLQIEEAAERIRRAHPELVSRMQARGDISTVLTGVVRPLGPVLTGEVRPGDDVLTGVQR